MIIDRILFQLQAEPLDEHSSVRLGRLGFFAWLMLLPGDCDVAKQARLASARVTSHKPATPSIAVLDDLLKQAAHRTPDRREHNLSSRKRQA